MAIQTPAPHRSGASRRLLSRALVAALLLVYSPGLAQADPNAPKLKPLPGFDAIPAGPLTPGTTMANIKKRALNKTLERALLNELWDPALGAVAMPAFYFGRYEVTNAQWKHYLDKNFKRKYKCKGGESLRQLSTMFYRPGGKGNDSEWLAIYAMNWKTLIDDWTKKERWNAAWQPHQPPYNAREKQFDIAGFPISKGTELIVYAHRVPMHWYGWCSLSKLQVGREYFDPRKPAAQAFQVPALPMFENMVPKLRAKDFAAYPIRSLSVSEIFAFCEWAGVTLPTEYQFERAVRGNRANELVHTTPAPWNSKEQRDIYAWQNNPACRRGPLAVDAPSVAGGDTQFGSRHVLGNVWELTRTFYDMHPLPDPKPPTPWEGLTNYCLIAKGASFGDRSAFLQLSTRTPSIGINGDFSFDATNRADSVGFRVVLNPSPGLDLLYHSRLRLIYDKGNGSWGEPYPHEFAPTRAAGFGKLHTADGAKAPYIQFTDRAKGIAFMPRHTTKFREKPWRKMALKKGKKIDFNTKIVLGIMRTDIPLRAGRRLSPRDIAKLKKARDDYKAWERKFKNAAKKKKAELKAQEPPKPPPKDDYEKVTEPIKKQIGLWREADLPAGEYYVVYWNGVIGFANKALTMPPDGILLMDVRKETKRNRAKPGMTQLVLDGEKGRIGLTFDVEELDPKQRRGQTAPREDQSDQWALADARKEGWIGRRPGKFSWTFQITIPVKDAKDFEQFKK